uniref:AIG1-type G domain-containing protein n=2 Tax=Echeneis naucrates TaxID=173247 RepID=A0A665TMJ6_ECHNA
SANTILAAGDSRLDQRQLFASRASSLPVTTECEVRIMAKPFGRPVRVVDTPDFGHEHLKNPQTHIEECKKYCQPGLCVLLLVLQLGRFTDAEGEILQSLERALGWRIRESTIVLLTHGDDLKRNREQFTSEHTPFSNIIQMCGGRYHLFNNNSKDTKQVIALMQKMSNYWNIFPKFEKKALLSECLLC